MRQLLFLQLLFLCVFGDELRPGVKAQLKTSSFDYLSSAAVAALEANLRRVTVPDVISAPGFSNYGVGNISLDSFAVSNNTVRFVPVSGNGIRISIDKAYIGLHGDYYFNFGPLMKETGGVVMDMAAMAMAFTIKSGMALGNDGRGRLTLSTADCTASVSSVALSFEGGSFNQFLNTFKSLIDYSLKPKMKDHICGQLYKDVNVMLSNELREMTMEVPVVDTGVSVDLSLTSCPKVGVSFIEADLSGESKYRGQSMARFFPHPLPQWPQTHQMFQVRAHEDVLNSFIAAFYQSGILNTTITKATVENTSPANAHYLNVSCSDYMCLGALLPTVNAKFGNTSLWINVDASSAPNVTLGGDGTAVVGLDLNLDIRAQFSNGSIIPIFDVDLVVGLILRNVSLETHDDFYVLSAPGLDCTTPKTRLNSINVGGITEEMLQGVFQFAVSFGVENYAAKAMKSGIHIPLSDPVRLQNTQIVVLDHSLFLAFDAWFHI